MELFKSIDKISSSTAQFKLALLIIWTIMFTAAEITITPSDRPNVLTNLNMNTFAVPWKLIDSVAPLSAAEKVAQTKHSTDSIS
jgi:hypothetical protein